MVRFSHWLIFSGDLGGLWIAFIGWFLDNAATAQVYQVMFQGLLTALEQMDRDGVNQLPVMTDGRMVGMLSREDVITFLRTLEELSAP